MVLKAHHQFHLIEHNADPVGGLDRPATLARPLGPGQIIKGGETHTSMRFPPPSSTNSAWHSSLVVPSGPTVLLGLGSPGPGLTLSSVIDELRTVKGSSSSLLLIKVSHLYGILVLDILCGGPKFQTALLPTTVFIHQIDKFCDPTNPRLPGTRCPASRHAIRVTPVHKTRLLVIDMQIKPVTGDFADPVTAYYDVARFASLLRLEFLVIAQIEENYVENNLKGIAAYVAEFARIQANYHSIEPDLQSRNPRNQESHSQVTTDGRGSQRYRSERNSDDLGSQPRVKLRKGDTWKDNKDDTVMAVESGEVSYKASLSGNKNRFMANLVKAPALPVSRTPAGLSQRAEPPAQH
ncbi:hypothetical protein Scep_023506 [Stephania cephalantha]|uniref:Uncharacterized protein n=1 Tax=Stephania cephalantha TaxID=152367 RepID=A0AAP0EVU9_9MAGN